ncbi:MAG TPA: V-type ATP synthase subunit E [Mobilitalea sp.]|nr:V-type ATP synthase subunit E [Mobilitalea sp.]
MVIMTLNEKLDIFYTSVIDSATAQNIEIFNEYSNTLNNLKDERRQAAIIKAKNTYRVEIDNIKREKNRKLSHDTLDIKRRVLERTSELTDNVFFDVEKKLAEFMRTPAYQEYLISKIKEANEFARNDVITIYINPSDTNLLPELEKATGVKLTVSNRDFFGGIRAVIPSRSILIDYSFITKLAEAKSTFKL